MYTIQLSDSVFSISLIIGISESFGSDAACYLKGNL